MAQEENKWEWLSRFCSDAQGIEACEESHPRPNNLELELVYVIRAPGAGDEPPIPL